MRYPLDKFFISQGYSAGHPALDLAASIGTPIFAPDDGIINGINNNASGYFGGLYVVLNDKSGYRHYIGHNSKNYVSQGQNVVKGQHIADVGMTGFAVPSLGIQAPTGPHVHWEIYFNSKGGGYAIDPQTIVGYVKGAMAQGVNKMITDKDIVPLRVLHVEIGLWNPTDTYGGKHDKTLMSAWVGKTWIECIMNQVTQGEPARRIRSSSLKRVPILEDQVKELTRKADIAAAIDKLNQTIKDKKS